jgi:5-hydroxyisourate hydrolase-like protein (transthyretin family)
MMAGKNNGALCDIVKKDHTWRLPMSAQIRTFILITLKVSLVLLIVAAFIAFYAIKSIPDRADAQQTIIIGQTQLIPDSLAAMRVVVQEVTSKEPVAGAQVNVRLKPESGEAISLFAGTTDADGSVPVTFQVPAAAGEEAESPLLIVETESPAGKDRLEQPVTIQREYRLLLSTDKPLYQPGQTIHLRALAFSLLDQTPARNANIKFMVQDPRGNKVFQQNRTTSEFGVAAADFTLADRVNQGDYKLSVSIGDTISEKTVEVRPYVLPKFGVEVSTARSFYLPGDRVEGVVQADYFYGKPVANSTVQVTGVVYDVERVELVNISGQTDENGTYLFRFDLPDYFAGSGLESQQAQFGLEVTVIDQTEHPEQSSRVLPIAEQPIIIEAVAESGTLRPGVENIVYILTSYPDGTPAQTEANIYLNQELAQTRQTGEYGLAEFRFVPSAGGAVDMAINARDAAGARAERSISFQTEQKQDHVLVRADRATYAVGETMTLGVLTPVEFGSIYLDIVKDGQTLSTRATPVRNGRADFAIDLSPDLYGTLELHAYKVLLDGTIVRDTRVVVVDEARDINISIAADKETYLPGELANINFQTGVAEGQARGEGIQTALGVAIVDESVFALQQQDPGFAKLYFLLEAEMMEPFYQIKGFELPTDYAPDENALRETQDASARAAWVDAPTAGLDLQVNTRPEKIETLHRQADKGLTRLITAVVWAMALIPLLVWLAVILALWGSGLVKRSLIGLLKVSGALLLVWGTLCGMMYGFVMLIWATDGSYDLAEILLIGFVSIFGLAFAGALIGLAIYAWHRQDEAGKFVVLLTGSLVGLFFLFVMLGNQGAQPPTGPSILAILTFLLLPGAYLLYGQKLWASDWHRPSWLPTTMGGTAFYAVIALLLLALFLTSCGAAPPLEGFGLVQATPESASVSDLSEEGPSAGSEPATTDAPRLRQFFPETLYWDPELLTDENGAAQLQISMADSITTWRLTALASSQDGRLGFATHGIRVFQDFFVDVDLPVSLTQDDEISIPVGVFNYLPEAQEVRLVVEPDPWFELLGQAEQTLTIGPNDIDVVYFPIRVREFGQKGFQVTAWGAKMNDAIRRSVRVVPNGQEIRLSESDWLREDTQVTLNLPPEVIPRTPHVEVKIYTGALAQVVEGLEKILRLPHG